jgi:hypothetical protein
MFPPFFYYLFCGRLPNMLNSRLPKWISKNLPFFLIIVFFIIYFWDFILVHGMFFSSDLRSNEFQLRAYLGHILKQGKFPLWSPDLYCGYPLLGDYMTGLYYPLNLVLFYILPDYAAFNYFILIHYLIIAISIYFYARLIGLSNLGALISSLIFTYGGQSIVRTAQTTHLIAITALPVILTLIELAYKRKRYLYIWLAGLVSGLSIFNGHPKIIGFTTLFTIIYILIKEKNNIQGIPLLSIAYIRRVGLKLAGFIGIMLGISAIQLIPFLEQQQFSYRATGMTYTDATLGSLPWQRFLTLLYPFAFGGPYESPELYSNFVETALYLGLASIFLIAVAVILQRKQFYVKFFCWTIIITLVLALGSNTPIYRLLYPLSFFSHSRVPAKILFLTSFAAAILAGVGFDSLSDLFNRVRLQKINKTLLFELGIYFGIGLILAGIIILTQPRWQYFLVQGITGNNFFAANGLWQTGMFVCIFLLFIFWLFLKRITIKTIQVLLITCLMLDLFWFGNILKQDLNRPVNLKLCLDKPAAVRIIQRDQANDYRVYSLSNQLYEGYDDIYESISLLTRFSGLYYHIPTFHLYGPAHILRYYELMEDIEAPWNNMTSQARAEKLYQKLTILSIANVKYIITKIPLSNNNLQLVHNGDVKVYRLKNSLPRVFFVPQAILLDNKSDILTYLNQPKFDPTQIVVLEKYPQSQFLHGNNPTNIPAEVQLKQEDLHRILLNTITSDSGFLFLSKYYYPGWHADIDGNETPINQANYIFSAIRLPPGKHIVTFTFRPLSFYLGLIITGFTLLIMLIGLIVSLRKKPR